VTWNDDACDLREDEAMTVAHQFGTYFRRREGGYGSFHVWGGHLGHDPSHSQAKVFLGRSRPMDRGSQERRSQDTAVAEQMYPSESENESGEEVGKQKQTKRT